MLDVIKNRKLYYTIAGILTAFSIVTVLFVPLNYGIDMTGWVQVEYTYDKEPLDIEKIRTKLESDRVAYKVDDHEAITSIQVYKITWEKKIGVVAWITAQKIDEVKLDTLKNTFKETTLASLKTFDDKFAESLYINIGASFGDYIRNTAMLTLLIALLAIGLYVAFAFSGFAAGISAYSFWSITIITLFHDVIVAAGIYIFLSIFFREYQIDTFFITALLTILGYSITDTIVVFDRTRTNLIKHIKKGKVSLEEVINLSVNETLTRSIYTSLALLIVLVAIFFFGPQAIHGFILVMIFWTLVGTYSSIFIASPILYDFNKNKEIKLVEKKQYDPEDKVVV